jgi:hypothetical protein
VGDIKDIAGAVKPALAAAITFIRIHMNQINFKIYFFFWHTPRLYKESCQPLAFGWQLVS